ncbi:MAG: IPT/TIG domain-containing protein [Planctomycetes bacterium]|nr:IPT/TIG domain-containing protein [Planctomycetota bacterium]
MNAALRITVVALSGALLCAAFAFGHGRLRFEGRAARWEAPRSLEFSLDLRGSSDIADDSELDAVRRAFATWSAVPGADLRFREVGSGEDLRWQRIGQHSVAFDEEGTSGWFPPGSGIVAVTPVLVGTRADRATGELPILDADILFNGAEFRFATDGRAGAFDVQAVATHEIGHWLGFDHSACAAATMFPFVTPGQVALRTLFSDDEALARATYPAEVQHGEMRGSLLHADRRPLPGGHVVVVDAEGKTVASALSDVDGSFVVAGLLPGRYGAYADPLDGLVSRGELSIEFLPHVDFARTWLAVPGAQVLSAGGVVDLGTRSVARASSLDLADLSGSLPRIVRGANGAFDLVARGSALESGCELSVAGGGVVPDGATRAFGTTIARRFVLQEGAALGARDLVVRNASGVEAVLTAALELVPQAPLLERMEPARGGVEGGEIATVRGAHLEEIAEVRLGGALCEIVTRGASALVLRVPAGELGYADLEVLRASGESARLREAWLRGASPSIEHVFPRAGSTSGGTRVALSGGPFSTRVRATLEGQPIALQRFDATTLQLVLPPHASGAVAIELFDPLDPALALRASFTYVEARDPRLASIAPARGPIAGGMPVEVRGSDFALGARLFAGSDARSYRGGAEATDVDVASSGLLRARMPALPAIGRQTLLLELPDGRGAVLEDAFVAGAMLFEREKLSALWSGAGDDVHYVEWARGESVEVELVAEKGSGFAPILELVDARGAILRTLGDGSEQALRLRDYEIERTETYALRVRGASALIGAYTLQWRSNPRALQKKLEGTTENATASERTIAMEFEGRSGLELQALLRLPDGRSATAVRLFGPRGEIALDPRDLRLSRGRVQLRGQELSAAGTYRLEVDSPLPTGARWQASLRFR